MTRVNAGDEITIGSSNVDLGDALRAHAREALVEAAGKYLQNLTSAGVHFAHEGPDYRCSITVQIGALPTMAADAQAKDAYLAFDQALSKVAKQMRRAKRALREDKATRADKEKTLRDGLRRTTE